MGRDMAKAFGKNSSYEVKATPTEKSFISAWKKAEDCVVIHTHGSPTGLFDENESGTPQIISLSKINKVPKRSSIRFVMMTACSTAGGKEKENVAYNLSRKINPKGIVIANKYTVAGGDSSFGASNNERGWVAYQNGKIVRHAEKIPVVLTMKKAYDIYRELVK